MAVASAACLVGTATAAPVGAEDVAHPEDATVLAAQDTQVHVEVVVAIDDEGAEVVSRSLQPGPASRPGVATGSTVSVIARDGGGRVVRTESVPAPTLVADYLDADGDQTGAIIPQTTTELVVDLPVGVDVTTLEVAVPDGGTTVVDVGEAPLGLPLSSLPATTIIQGGSTANAVDVVFLGDGYTAGELGKFASDVDAAARHLLAQHPFDQLGSRVNIHRVDVASAESGTDDMCAGVDRDTAFDTAFHSTGADCRSLYSTSSAKIRDAAAAAPAADTVMVLVNTDVYGGAAYFGGSGFSYTGTYRDEVVAHEFGHSFGLLADEYDYGSGSWPGGEISHPNLTSSTDRTTLKWGSWVDPTTALPTTDSGVEVPGAYQGGGTYASGLFRPTFDSKMRSLLQPFGRVNAELLTRRVMASGPADTTPPTAGLAQSGETAGSVLLTLSMGDPQSRVIGYQLSNTGNFSDSAMQPAGLTASSNVDVTWPVSATPSTVWLRVRNGAGTETTTSAVVATTGRPDLVVTDIQWSPTSPTPGAAVTFRTTVENQGTAPTPNGVIHGVAFSVDGKLVTWSDTYASSLAPGASVTVTANSGPNAVASWGATAGTHTIKAAVDDINRIPDEANETNNTFTASLTVGPAVLAITPSDVSFQEPLTGQAVGSFVVSIPAPTDLAVRFTAKTANGTAVSGSDYVALASKVFTIPVGAVSVSVPVTLKGDALDEPNETFNLVLSAPVGATLAKTTAVATIVDTDEPPGFSVADATVVEGNGTKTVLATITLPAALKTSASVKLATAATGTATTADYTAKAPTTVTFTAGQVKKTVAITIKGDTVIEPNETFGLVLSSPVGAAITDGTAVVTIVDDDTTPVLSVQPVSTVEGNSGTRLATFSLRLDRASGKTVSVNYKTVNGTATAGTDYTARALTTVSFTPGQTSKTVTVSIRGDLLKESNETYKVQLSTPVNLTLASTQITGTITNDD